MNINALLIHPRDNVAVVTRIIRRGEAVCLSREEELLCLTAAEDIPIYHKIAVRDISEGARVIKYAHPIGKAVAPIRAGEHVHTHNVVSDEEKEAK